MVYLTTRLALAIFMGVGVWAVAHLEDQRLHLHHWFTMQLAATIASFNTKVNRNRAHSTSHCCQRAAEWP